MHESIVRAVGRGSMPSSGTSSETAFTVELKGSAGYRPVSSARSGLMESAVRASNRRYFIGGGRARASRICDNILSNSVSAMDTFVLPCG